MSVPILYIIDSLTHGGTEKQLVQLINALNGSHFRPHICTLKASGGLFDELEVPKVCLNFQSFVRPSIIAVQRRLINFINKHQIQIIQTFFQDPFLLAALVKSNTGVKLIGSFRDLGFWRTRTESIKMRIACVFFDGFTANSQAVKDYIVSNDKIQHDKIEVIYNGIDLNALPRPALLAQQQNPIVGIVANLNRPVKRVEDFIRAAALVAKQQTTVRFVVIGGGHLQASLIEIAKSLDLSKRITFTGRVDNPLDYVKDFSVGVITSETEGFCNAIIEYMALGVPVVATATGGNLEIIHSEKNGYLYPVGDYQALAGRIIHLLAQPEKRRTMAQAGQEIIKREFSLEKMVHHHHVFYNKFIIHSSIDI